MKLNLKSISGLKKAESVIPSLVKGEQE